MFCVIFTNRFPFGRRITKDGKDCVQIERPFTMCCGMHFKGKRPDFIIIEKPKSQTEVSKMKYNNWINKAVRPLCEVFKEFEG